MARDLQCNPDTLAGPIDVRVVAKIQRRYPLDPAFLDQMATCHGGVPQIATFDVDFTQWQIGQFLSLLDDESKLTPPKRPHFEQSAMDERVVNGISYLMDYEHSTSRALFTGLVPFAALDRDMCLDRANVNLMCFDYRNRPKTPTVKMWLAHNANDAYMDWDELPIDQQFDADDNFLSVPWDTFLTPVADCFDDFIQMLR
jgi:hypothetical protein